MGIIDNSSGFICDRIIWDSVYMAWRFFPIYMARARLNGWRNSVAWIFILFNGRNMPVTSVNLNKRSTYLSIRREMGIVKICQTWDNSKELGRPYQFVLIPADMVKEVARALLSTLVKEDLDK